MMRLDDRNWGTFYVGDLFVVKRPAARNKDDYQKGAIPFVASGGVNNGVMKCCQPLEDEVLDAAGCITVSPVDGSAFYQPYPFLGRGGAGSSVLMLYRDGINLYTGQFIARMVANTCVGKYTYGHMGNKDSIKRERIMLPVTETGEPDYQFMEDYVRELMAAKRKQYRQYVEKRLEPLELAETNGGGGTEPILTRAIGSLFGLTISFMFIRASGLLLLIPPRETDLSSVRLIIITAWPVLSVIKMSRLTRTFSV